MWLKRPSRIILLLVGTGVPPFAFTVVLFLVPIPDEIFRYLGFAFLVVPLVIFLPTLAYFEFRDVCRRSSRTRQQVLRAASKCAICNVPLPTPSLRELRQVQGPHYQGIHPEYWAWSEKWRRIGLVVWLTDLFVMALGLYELIGRNYLFLIFSVAFVLASMVGFFWFQRKRQQRFRTAWLKKSPDNSPLFSGTNLIPLADYRNLLA